MVLAGPDGESWEGWEEAASTAASELGVEVDFRRIDTDRFQEAYGLTGGGTTLVRPDGFVAWRSGGEDSADALTDVLRQVLHPA
jgi:putative polyketide hydroxylase